MIHEAIEDDAKPGEWLVVEIDEAGNDGPTLARFSGKGAEGHARRMAAELDRDDKPTSCWYIPFGTYCLGVATVIIILDALFP